MIDTEFNEHRRRLHIRYSGFWSAGNAQAALATFQSALTQAAATGPFTLLDDLRDWSAQSGDVVEINKAFAELCAHVPILRNAMVIPQALVRSQVRRTLDGNPNCRIFEQYAEADAWLAEVELG